LSIFFSSAVKVLTQADSFALAEFLNIIESKTNECGNGLLESMAERNHWIRHVGFNVLGGFLQIRLLTCSGWKKNSSPGD
jgi:hypothetical protein